MAKDIIFGAQFIESKLGKTGLTVTFNVYRVTISDLTVTQTVTSGSGTAVGQGLYIYKVAGADLQTYYYFAVAATATTTVDQREIPAVQMDWVDRSAGIGVSGMIGSTTFRQTVTTAWAEVLNSGSSLSGKTFYIGLQSEQDSVQIAFGTSAPLDTEAGTVVNFLNNKEQSVASGVKLYIRSNVGKPLNNVPFLLSS